MAIKTNEFQTSTILSVTEIRQRIQPALARAEIRKLKANALHVPADLEFLAETRGLRGQAAIQVLVFDHGDIREVQVTALGDGGMARAWGGVKNTLSLSKSIQLAEGVIQALK